VKKEWRCLINLDENKKMVSVEGRHLIRSPLPDEHLLCGLGSQEVVAVYYSQGLKEEKGGVEVHNLMNGYREVLLSESEYANGFRLSYIFMAYGTIIYARYHDRSKFVDWVRRTELRVCNNKLE